MPRLAATFDLKGDGRIVICRRTYAHYAGKYSEAQFANNTDVANPSLVRYDYTGPAGQGMDFAPGFDPANYTAILDGTFPTANVFFEDGLHSPVTRSSRRRSAARSRRGRYAKADLRLARRRRLHRGLHHARQRHDRRSSATA